MSLPPSYNLLSQYPNKYFIESGSYRGDAIRFALDAGFKHIRSIDIDNANIRFCHSRFALPNRLTFEDPIYLRTGNSAFEFYNLFADIKEPATFWLDAHSQWFEDEPPNETPFPLLRELHQIALHPIKFHTILIDDILILTHPNVTGWTRKTIEDAVLNINPAYKFQYIANPVKGNLLICSTNG